MLEETRNSSKISNYLLIVDADSDGILGTTIFYNTWLTFIYSYRDLRYAGIFLFVVTMILLHGQGLTLVINFMILIFPSI